MSFLLLIVDLELEVKIICHVFKKLEQPEQ